MNRKSRITHLNNIKESQKSNIIFHSLESSKSNIIMNLNNDLQLINDYIELNKKGSFLLLNNKFYEALRTYQNSLSIAEKLSDDYKKNESKCNIGIAHFYTENINEAINFIQPCYNYINSICSFELGMNNIKNLYLLCKSGANLCMCQLTIKSQNSTSLINSIIEIISKEEDINKQLLCIKYLNNILFKVNSLQMNNTLNNNYNNDNFGNQNGNEYNYINQLFIESFDNFLATNKIENWINSLNIIYNKIQELNDKSGIIIILLHQQLALFLKNTNKFKNNNNNTLSNNSEFNEAKIKLANILQNSNDENNNDDILMNNNRSNNNININNEDNINNIIEDYKFKMFVIRKIYQMMYSFEGNVLNIQEEKNNENNNSNIYDINGNQNIVCKNSNNYLYNNIVNYNNNYYQENIILNINSDYYFKLLLKYAKNYIKDNTKDINLKNNLIKNIDIALNLLIYKKIDFSQLNISSIDPDISKSLSLLLNNIFEIYRRNKLKYCFQKFKLGKLRKKKSKKNENNNNNENKINDDNKEDPNLKKFFEKKYKYIYNGEVIKKINYNSTGTKEHFYQIDSKNDLFESFPSDPNFTKPKKVYSFDDIKKIVVGIKTSNLIKKIKSTKNDKKAPYLFMSLVLKKRTIDLVFTKEKSAKNWFYGFYYYFKESQRKYKISSCTSNILLRIKSKIFKQLGKNINEIDGIPLSSCIVNYFKKSSKKKGKKNKTNDILEDMCIMGNDMKEEILETTKMNPKAFIPIEEALKNKKSDFYCLGVLACYLENNGVTTAIERETNDKNESFDIINYILNGMLEKKKYNMSFDFGKNKNNNLLNDENEQEILNNKIRKKISLQYNIPENETIIISNPQKKNYEIQVIFQSNEFNNLDLKSFKQKFKNDELLSCLKDIHSTLIMEGIKLNKNMLDSRGNKISGWKEKRGGFNYFPPYGWIGFGLNIKGKYDKGNNDWLAKNGNKNEWAVAYHGLGNKRQNKKDNNNNYKKGFQNEDEENDEDYDNNDQKGQKPGKEIYCSPKPSILEEYTSFSETKNDINGAKYMIGLMMRVKPDKIRNSSDNKEYWVLNSNINEVRPYRILIKENLNSSTTNKEDSEDSSDDN